jgi:hypothetical protein
MSDSDFVTQREFARLEGTVNEIHGDIKLLLAAHNREEGAWTAQAISAQQHRDGGARRLALGSLLASAVMALSTIFGNPHHL